jgi:hypothetical protein
MKFLNRSETRNIDRCLHSSEALRGKPTLWCTAGHIWTFMQERSKELPSLFQSVFYTQFIINPVTKTYFSVGLTSRSMSTCCLVQSAVYLFYVRYITKRTSWRWLFSHMWRRVCGRNLLTFRRNILPPSSGSNSKPSRLLDPEDGGNKLLRNLSFYKSALLYIAEGSSLRSRGLRTSILETKIYISKFLVPCRVLSCRVVYNAISLRSHLFPHFAGGLASFRCVVISGYISAFVLCRIQSALVNTIDPAVSFGSLSVCLSVCLSVHCNRKQ